MTAPFLFLISWTDLDYIINFAKLLLSLPPVVLLSCLLALKNESREENHGAKCLPQFISLHSQLIADVVQSVMYSISYTHGGKIVFGGCFHMDLLNVSSSSHWLAQDGLSYL